MTVAELAAAFTALLKEGKDEEASARFSSDDIVSIEAMDGPMSRLEGREALAAKRAWWEETFEVHGAEVHGPFVNGDQFAVRFWIDCTERPTGNRTQMDEVGLYTVKDGKIVEERFFY
jgi:ketosteroid isomerase-like protein